MKVFGAFRGPGLAQWTSRHGLPTGIGLAPYRRVGGRAPDADRGDRARGQHARPLCLRPQHRRLRGVTEYSFDEVLGLAQSAPFAFLAAPLSRGAT